MNQIEIDSFVIIAASRRELDVDYIAAGAAWRERGEYDFDYYLCYARRPALAMNLSWKLIRNRLN